MMSSPFKKYRRQVAKVLLLTFVLNIIVAVMKLVYGHLSHTLSMTSDGYHSLLDSASNVIGFITLWFAAKPADKEHPYGHRKYEALGAMGISILLCIACYEILTKAWDRFQTHLLPEVTYISFLIMIFTMMINYGVSVYENKKGKQYHSQILTADSAHTRSDVYASLSVLVSLVAVKFHFYIIDVIAAMMIVLLIARAAYSIITESLNILLDHAQLGPQQIRNIVLPLEGIFECHDIRTRGTKYNIFMDLCIHVDPKLDTASAHKLTHQVIDKIKGKYPEVVDVVIHTEPVNHH